MSATDAGPATTLEGVVTAIPGVTRLYPATGLLGRVSATVGAAVAGGAPEGEAAVSADRIAIRIGVGTTRGAAAVCRDVYAAARAWAATGGMPDAVIEVTAASIEDSASDMPALPQPPAR